MTATPFLTKQKLTSKTLVEFQPKKKKATVSEIKIKAVSDIFLLQYKED